MKKRGLDLSLLDEVVDTLRQGKQLDSIIKAELHVSSAFSI